MVAKITFPKSVRSALNYNEHKLQKGHAACIGAGNVLGDPQTMNFYRKLAIFENRNILNDRANTKTLHVSLNFDPSEKLTESRLAAIAERYMEMIGFGEQPYLVYQHLDAGHPHLHIVSTTIRRDGSRINTHNIGRNQSEEARKSIEQRFRLISAEGQKRLTGKELPGIAKVVYGKSETKSSISNVLNSVVDSYNYTSLAALNAVLKQYNIVADRGEKEGRIYKSGGLVYRILDEEGNKTGVPIKASALISKPTLAYLDKRFEANKEKRELLKQLLKKSVEETLERSPESMKELIALLAQKNVFTVLRQNEEGRLYGITFVDNQNKAVFNGSDLGKAYGIAGLQSRLFNLPKIPERTIIGEAPEKTNESLVSCKREEQQESAKIRSLQRDGLLQLLLSPEQSNENIPAHLLKQHKKRKKKNRNL